MIQNVRKTIQQFHDDEDGIEAIQVIMIVAIAAIVLIAVMTVGQEVMDWLKEQWNELRGKKVS
jgi:Flp pilus assembly pilin Flp